MALEGTIRDFGLPDIFQLIGLQRKTGILTLRNEKDTVTVTFENGMVVMAASEPHRIIVARQDSPLVIGVGPHGRYAASDMPALLPLTRDFVVLENGEHAVLEPQAHRIYDRAGRVIPRESVRCDWTPEQAEKQGFPHFMLKEIHEQPDVLARTAFERCLDLEGDVSFEEGFGLSDAALRGIGRLRFMAMGTSLHAAMIGQQLAGALARLPGETLNASEFLYSAELEEGDALTVVVSQSGETADSLRALREVKRRGGRVLGICNVRGSTLAREADHLIFTHCGPEIGVASTKAFFGQVVALYLLAIRLGRARGVLDAAEGRARLADLRGLRHRMEALFEPPALAAVRSAAEFLAGVRSCLFLGRALQHPVALEGALKLKEISYIHAEGYPAAEMKHGPIALIDDLMPVVFIAPKDAVYQKVVSNVEEVKARGGRVIAIVTEGDTEIAQRADAVFPIPATHDLLTPILASVPLQLFAYYVAVRRGCDVDQPRNLAKSVTVE